MLAKLNMVVLVGFLVVLLCSCDSEEVLHDTEFSGCGGFSGDVMFKFKESAGVECNEMLEWSYDSENYSLSLTNTNITLNCCGDHSITVTENDGGFIVTEKDAPVSSDGRCLCTCIFDFKTTLANITDGVVPIELRRNITDQDGGEKLIWSGSLDLSEKSGEILIKEQNFCSM